MIEYHNTKVVFIYAKIMQNQLVAPASAETSKILWGYIN
jgi:hypothetical protein